MTQYLLFAFISYFSSFIIAVIFYFLFTIYFFVNYGCDTESYEFRAFSFSMFPEKFIGNFGKIQWRFSNLHVMLCLQNLYPIVQHCIENKEKRLPLITCTCILAFECIFSCHCLVIMLNPVSSKAVPNEKQGKSKTGSITSETKLTLYACWDLSMTFTIYFYFVLFENP